MSGRVDFAQGTGAIWFDGALVAWDDAQTHLLTHALHYGSCVFEGVRMYGGHIYALEEHTDRLFASARMLDMAIPFAKETINQACHAAAKAQDLRDGYIRPVVYRGSEMMGVAAQDTTIHVAVAAWAWPSYFDPEAQRKGIRLDIARWQRPAPTMAPAHAKAAGLYMIATLSKHEAETKGLADALMLDYRGFVAEATGANVFFVKDGALHTPIADCFLDGITRKAVMRLAREQNVPIHERHIALSELSDFEECFLTGTAAEVTAVAQAGEFHFTPGAITSALRNAYLSEANGR